MYDTHIQTTLSIRGHVVFIEYMMTPEWALDWWLNEAAYETEDASTVAALELLTTMLRCHEATRIETQLYTEFESRQYEMEQRASAELAKEDIPF